MRLNLTVCAECSHRTVATLSRSVPPALVDAAAVLPHPDRLIVVSAACIVRCGRAEPLVLEAVMPSAPARTELSEAVEAYLRDRLRGPHPEG